MITPTPQTDEQRDAHAIYERGVYAGIILLLWFILFSEFRYPFVGYIVFTCLSFVLMAIYDPIIRLIKRALQKRAKSPRAQFFILLGTTMAYEGLSLWSLRYQLPGWLLLIVAIVMTGYYAYRLNQHQG